MPSSPRTDEFAAPVTSAQQIDPTLKELMVTTATAQLTTQCLEAPGATLAYDVRRSDSSAEPPLMLIGAPMGADGFVSLASHFTDRTVITYDPRGTERSVVRDPGSTIDPEVHADDIHQVIDAVGLGPVDLFASSGGAVNALALLAKHPGDVRTVVAHEPPLASLLPDRNHVHVTRRQCRHGPLHRRGEPQRTVHRRRGRSAGARSRHVRHAGR
jgi:pimeloyl-ACP methyl ester carboxylesterase